MKLINKNISAILIAIVGINLLFLSGCNDDNSDDITIEITADAGMAQSVSIESMVTVTGSGMGNDGLSYTWSITDPNGDIVSTSSPNTLSTSFRASLIGEYDATFTVSDADGNNNASTVTITSNNVTYAQTDQMGRPGINTVFNFFGDEDTKNGFNQILPKDGSANTMPFTGIFNALQSYIGLDPDTYKNVLGLDNATTASVLAVDVLNCNKDAASTYGPSDLGNIVLFDNVLNGRKLTDDVIDVTLILTFFGDGNTGNSLVPGLVSDNVSSNDKDFSDSFPYLASPH